MFARAQKAVQSKIAAIRDINSDTSPDYTSIIVPLQDLPDYYSFEELSHELTNPRDGNLLVCMLVLGQCLQHPERIIHQPEDSTYIHGLWRWLSSSIRPTKDLIGHDEVLIGDAPVDRELTLEKLRSMSISALRIMRLLDLHIAPSKQKLEPAILLAIIAHTDIYDPWNSETVRQAAEQVLEDHLDQLLAHEFIVDYVLEGFIRPLFSNSNPAAVTSSGRKAINPDPRHPSDSGSLPLASERWRFQEVSTLATFRWAIKNMNEVLVHQSWHLCIPPLLTLLDDSSTSVRTRGLSILSILLNKTPAKLLDQTGIGEVFEDAVIPTLHFLPSLTPVEDSLRLLKPAYEVLLQLGEVRYSRREKNDEKMKFLDRVMRQGVLQGLVHSGDNIKIAELLVVEMAILAQRMGVHSVKHLKDMVPILSNILTDPFATSHPGLLLLAVKTTQAVIANCWPRMTMSNYRIEFIKAFVVCWNLIQDHTSLAAQEYIVELEAVKKELVMSAQMLIKSVEGCVDIAQELEPLVEADFRLGALFNLKSTLD